MDGGGSGIAVDVLEGFFGGYAMGLLGGWRWEVEGDGGICRIGKGWF